MKQFPGTGIVTMTNTQDAYEPGKRPTTIRTLTRAVGRFFPACLTVVCLQLTCTGTIHASEAMQDELDRDERATSLESTENTSTTMTTRRPAEAASETEVHCLALNIYFEARSEPEAGQQAVGHVVMNRVAHPGYPDTVCEVVKQGGEEALHRCQFSWWCDGQSDKPLNQKAWDQARRVAYDVYLGLSEDATDGALWYHATYVKPYWSELLRRGDRIGQHIFYLDNRRPQQTL